MRNEPGHDELDHVDDEHAPTRELLILYATETGNAQDCADYISRQCRRIAFSLSGRECRYLLPEEPLVVFVLATTGSGVEPRSMTALWNTLLRSDLPEDLFEGLPFAVLGLGDSSYERFCWAAKLLSRRMNSLGATEICPRGEANEQDQLGIDEVLHPWTDTLLNTLLHLAPLPTGVEPVSQTKPPSRVVLEETTARVKANERITASDWYQDVRHFEFEFQGDIKYDPGDVAIIHPVATNDDVDSFLEIVRWSDRADVPCVIRRHVEDQSLPDFLPQVSTLREIFTRYLDFNSVPRRNFFQYLRYFSEEELETEKLDDFLSPQGADELYEYCQKVRRTIKEVLTEFRNVRIPIDYIFDVFPPLRPRHFSIASSIQSKYRTKLKVPRRGVCTSYLAQLRPGDTLRIGFLKGLIRLPPSDGTPVICIGPGTGVAPMRALIEERFVPANTLFFGCRSEAKDQHYGEQWRSLAESGALEYRTAFSRDGPEGVKRTYVQDRILEDSERIWQLVNDAEAWIYISGSSNKMPMAVKEAISKAAVEHGGYSEEAAKDYVNALLKEGRLMEECWS
ncbi:riboflavin synthase domain-like protein [Coprinellus micaceus]|uniref:NADPH-dependent diflavin oxidoreductase 1 n=1 Tax=Coprinellus micaceus TaxID=71717 RepID=A0A4Y7TJF8_COPMI|nr:riboflavin synthase domain-like protein [Coprinellus micaceus]